MMDGVNGTDNTVVVMVRVFGVKLSGVVVEGDDHRFDRGIMDRVVLGERLEEDLMMQFVVWLPLLIQPQGLEVRAVFGQRR